MVRLRVKVGPKGQIVIPKLLREAYNIVEGSTVVIEPREEGILIRKNMDPDEVIGWIRARRRKLRGRMGRLGELEGVSLEEEFGD